MAFSIDIKGDLQGELLDEFNRIKDLVEEYLAVNMGEAAKEIQTKIPVRNVDNVGSSLKSGFSTYQNGDFEFVFENAIFYAPFVDFGTGSQVQIPAGMEAFAREFYRTGKGRMRAQPHMTSVVQKYWLQFLDDVLKIP